MAYQFKKELEKPERFVGGHRAVCRLRRRHHVPGGDAGPGA